MVQVSADLIKRHVKASSLVARAFNIVENDREVQELLKMANIMAVTRLLYNDHGPTHSKIVAGAALEIFEILANRGVEPTTLRDSTAKSRDEARLIVFLAAYLHDIGNAIHRHNHELHGYVLAKPILERILPDILGEHPKIFSIRQEVLHAIYAHQNDVRALTMEAGVIKIADGTDMAQGRARIPYRLGKMDIHAVSALSVRRVEIEEGDERPVRITVEMEDMAGLFQVEEVFMPKILTSGLEDYVELRIEVPSRGVSRTVHPSG